MGEWVKTSDCLPENGQRVWFVLDPDHPSVWDDAEPEEVPILAGYFPCDEWKPYFRDDAGGWYSPEIVFCWMPRHVPALPDLEKFKKKEASKTNG